MKGIKKRFTLTFLDFFKKILICSKSAQILSFGQSVHWVFLKYYTMAGLKKGVKVTVLDY